MTDGTFPSIAREQDHAIPIRKRWERGPGGCGALDTPSLSAHGGACVSPGFPLWLLPVSSSPAGDAALQGEIPGLFWESCWEQPRLGDPGGVPCVPTAITKRSSPLPALHGAVRTEGHSSGLGTRDVGAKVVVGGVTPSSRCRDCTPVKVTRDERAAPATPSSGAGAGIGTASKAGRGHRDHLGAQRCRKSRHR